MTPQEIYEALLKLSDQERMEVFSQFCCHCGSDESRCYCWNDE